MNNLQWYLVRHYAHLFSDYERSAIKRMYVDAKVRAGYSTGVADVLRARHPWTDGDPEVVVKRACERLLAESPDQIVLTRCPKCDALCRSPRAKLCPSCHYAWHAE